MQYFDFTKELLKRFPDFREYYFNEKKANEIDLLPSNIEFDFIDYYDHSESGKQDLIIDELAIFLNEMKESTDEDLVMLYNETINDIDNTTVLKEKFKNNNIFFLGVDPHRTLSEEEAKGRFLKKRIEVDYKGNKYIEENKKLLEEYKK